MNWLKKLFGSKDKQPTIANHKCKNYWNKWQNLGNFSNYQIRYCSICNKSQIN